MEDLDRDEIERRRRRQRGLEGLGPREWASLLLGLAAREDAWIEARMPGLLEEMGDGWRDELRAIALRLMRWRRDGAG
jgi:hypothetical protein